MRGCEAEVSTFWTLPLAIAVPFMAFVELLRSGVFRVLIITAAMAILSFLRLADLSPEMFYRHSAKGDKIN
jgi:hypothetical protein